MQRHLQDGGAGGAPEDGWKQACRAIRPPGEHYSGAQDCPPQVGKRNYRITSGGKAGVTAVSCLCSTGLASNQPRWRKNGCLSGERLGEE